MLNSNNDPKTKNAKLHVSNDAVEFAGSTNAPVAASNRASGRSSGPIGRLVSLIPEGRGGPLYLVVCISLLCCSLYLGQQQIEFCKRAERVTGTVTGHSTSGHDHFSLVEFQYQGQTYGQDLRASEKLQEGDEVSVLVEPGNPQKAVINSVTGIFASSLVSAIGALFFGFFTLLKFRDFKFRR